ncbi:hypothetical protein V1525DRAFT_407722 [Lipomyces kononenkoae]|uniref:Uncharacterized protein n=1 Tax=Lipomyces kononenkoae TaxID=34357 RepID=A0ACC3SXI8_LIPKO
MLCLISQFCGFCRVFVEFFARGERSQSRSASRTRPITRRNARCCCGSGSCSSERERYGSLRCRQRSLSPTSM